MTFTCKAKPTVDPPQDCGWPECGCDPGFEPVVKGLQEAGWLIEAPTNMLRSAVAKVRAEMDWRGPNGRKSRYVVLEREEAAALIGYEEHD